MDGFCPPGSVFPMQFLPFQSQCKEISLFSMIGGVIPSLLQGIIQIKAFLTTFGLLRLIFNCTGMQTLSKKLFLAPETQKLQSLQPKRPEEIPKILVKILLPKWEPFRKSLASHGFAYITLKPGVLNGISLGFEWDFLGIWMGFLWDLNGIYLSVVTHSWLAPWLLHNNWL